MNVSIKPWWIILVFPVVYLEGAWAGFPWAWLGAAFMALLIGEELWRNWKRGWRP